MKSVILAATALSVAMPAFAQTPTVNMLATQVLYEPNQIIWPNIAPIDSFLLEAEDAAVSTPVMEPPL